MKTDQRPPTPAQMARAADTLRRFKRTAELNAQDYSIIEHAEQMIGFAAIARQAETARGATVTLR